MQSKEFREILMTKMRNFDFENGSTALSATDAQCFHFEGNFLLKGNFCKVKEI